MRPVLVSLLVITSFCISAIAQSAIVTGKKVTYTRPRVQADHKKTFTINYPKFKGLPPAVLKRIERSLSYETLFNFKIREELRELQWLEEADYEVLYNKNGLLSMRMYISGSGAYPSGSTKNVTIDLKTGNPLTAADVFTSLPGLISVLRKAQQSEIAQAITEIKKDPENADLDTKELFAKARFTAKDLNGFSVDDNGLTFVYDYGFPHVIQVLAPDGQYLLSWKALRPYIRRAGAFGQFAR